MRLLEDKIAIITGGGHGIGRAIVHQYSEEGATVIIAEFDENSGRETADSVGGYFVKTDISDEISITSLFEYVRTKFSRLDILVNNAGAPAGPDRVSVVNLSECEWDKVQNINIKGVFLMSREVVRHMLQHQIKGKIIIEQIVR